MSYEQNFIYSFIFTHVVTFIGAHSSSPTFELLCPLISP